MKKTFFVFFALVLVACQPSDEERAQLILTEAQALVEDGQWRHARIVLDSLHTTYPRLVAQRRQAKALSDSITYLEAQRTLTYVDTLLPPLMEQVDKLVKRFKYEKNEQYEDYGKYVHRLLVTNKNTARNFIQAYVLDNRHTVVRSYYYGSKQVCQQSLKISADGEERVYKGNNHHFQDGSHYEIMTLDDDNSLSLLNFVSTHGKKRIRIEGMGNKPSHTWIYYLNDKEKEALSDTYQLGWLMKDINRLEQMQRTAHAQIDRYNSK